MDRYVFAHYYTWFASQSVSGHWSHWNWDDGRVIHDPEKFKEVAPAAGTRRPFPQKIRDIASFYHPLIGAYDSFSAEVQSFHADLAQSAGIDAFCVDWYGPGGKEPRTDRASFVDGAFEKLLETAREASFSACVCYEEKILTGGRPLLDSAQAVADGKKHLAYISGKYFSREGYWKIDGRPVLVIWGNHALAAEDWREILSSVSSWNPRVFYPYHWPFQNTILESRDLLDALYAWMNIKDLRGQEEDLEGYYTLAEASLKDGRTRILGGGVWPGFNDSGVNGWGQGTRVIPDPRDELYDLTWNRAIEKDPALVSIATWNDWNEGSIIEPSLEQRFKRLDQTRDYIRKFKKMAREPFDFEKHFSERAARLWEKNA